MIFFLMILKDENTVKKFIMEISIAIIILIYESKIYYILLKTFRIILVTCTHLYVTPLTDTVD